MPNNDKAVFTLGVQYGSEVLFNDKFTNGIIGPSIKMLGPMRNGGYIIFDIFFDEVRNRVTTAGAVEIGRLPRVSPGNTTSPSEEA